MKRWTTGLLTVLMLLVGAAPALTLMPNPSPGSALQSGAKAVEPQIVPEIVPEIPASPIRIDDRDGEADEHDEDADRDDRDEGRNHARKSGGHHGKGRD
ncbi:MAG: hypothetical protein WC876_07445 [Candidatus Thermoplasmatota archaeon]|jgi:hypothetical protein